jgi:hypothetical protein
VKTIVTFEFDSPAEAAAVLSSFTANATAPKEEAAPAPAPKPGRPTKAEAAAKTEVVAATPPTAATAPTAAPAAPAADAAALLNEVKERVGKLVAVSREKAVALLGKYGAQKASQVPADKLAECKAELDAALMSD